MTLRATYADAHRTMMAAAAMIPSMLIGFLFGLPEELVRSLLAWQRHFDYRFSHDREPGWDHPASAAWYAAEGLRLGDEPRQALPEVKVILDLWPVTNPPPSQ